MHRTDAPDHTVVDGLNRFIDQNLPGVPGTVLVANWANAVQEELAAVIEAAGLTLAASGAADSAAGWGQLKKAIFESNALGAAAIAAGAIGTSELADSSVTAAKIAANAVGSSELADNAVDTAAIQDKAVTAEKLADGAVGNTQLTDMSISKLTAGTTDISQAVGSWTYSFKWGNTSSVWSKSQTGFLTFSRESEPGLEKFKAINPTNGKNRCAASVGPYGFSALQWTSYNGERDTGSNIVFIRDSMAFGDESADFSAVNVDLVPSISDVGYMVDILHVSAVLVYDGAASPVDTWQQPLAISRVEPQDNAHPGNGKVRVVFTGPVSTETDGYIEFLFVINSSTIGGV